MIKKLNLLEAIEYVESHEDYLLAFRGDDYIPVKKFRPSRYHGDDNERKRSVGGVSAVSIDNTNRDTICLRACIARQYGENVFLVAYKRYGYGEDQFELILSDHEIIGVIGAENFKKKEPLPGSDYLEHPFEIAVTIPEKEVKDGITVEKKMSFEEWCMKSFSKIWPNSGIFADQYARYVQNG